MFVDGCFWHGCPIHATAPENNAEWWREKLDENVQRDRRNTRALERRLDCPACMGTRGNRGSS